MTKVFNEPLAQRIRDAVLEPHVSEFNITWRAMKGWVLVAPEGVKEAGQVKAWIQRAVQFVGKLPEK